MEQGLLVPASSFLIVLADGAEADKWIFLFVKISNFEEIFLFLISKWNRIDIG